MQTESLYAAASRDTAIWVSALVLSIAGCSETVIVAADPDANADRDAMMSTEDPDGGPTEPDAATSDAGNTGPCSVPTLPELQAGRLGPSSPTWERPSTVFDCPSQTTSIEVPYETFTFCADHAGIYELAVRVEEPMHTLEAPALFVYEGTEIARDTTRCLAVSDEDPVVLLTRDAVIDRLPLDAGHVITVVVTSERSSEAYGTYELRTREVD